MDLAASYGSELAVKALTRGLRLQRRVQPRRSLSSLGELESAAGDAGVISQANVAAFIAN